MKKFEAAILEVINGSQAHLTAEEIYLLLKGNGLKVSMATVYNNLNDLCRQNAVHRVSVEGHADRYDRAVKHDHLLCKSCGKLSDICFADLTEGLEKQLGQEVYSYDLRVSYLCEECRKAQEKLTDLRQL